MTVIEKNKKIQASQKKDAELLIGEMFSFIPISEKGVTHSLLSAKYCAKVACDFLIKSLPNINETPPIKRQVENKYSQYWRGVKSEIEEYKVN